MTETHRIQAKRRTQFEIDLEELEIIEEALRFQAQSLTEKDTLDDNEFRSRMDAIQRVLGKLHNQKVWFVPKEPVPLG